MSTTQKNTGGHANTKLWVRMYRVGFGDCFLVAVPTKKGPRFILIDCGEHSSHIGSLPAVVDDIATVTDSHLSLVIATHRHADHLRGFYKCAARFRAFTVDAVWMSCWDNPDDKQAVALQAHLLAQAEAFEQQVRPLAATDDVARAALGLTGLLTGRGLAAAATGPDDSDLSNNAAALAMLRGAPEDPVYCFKNSPVRHYYRGGDKAALPTELAVAGLGVKILGPPTDPGLLSDMDAKAQYLRLVAESAHPAPLKPFDSDWRTSQYPPDALHPFQARQLEQLIRAVQPDTLLAGAALADNTINNQSLVVLFTFAGKTLLFTGDAQWGNWENFLYGQDVSKMTAPQLLPASKKMLAALDLYKVGHHGSTNATPMAAVGALRKGAVALCSTEPGCFGSVAKNSEVPRGPLLAELAKKGPVVRSDQVAAGEAKANATVKLPPHFSSPGNQLYIDYEF